MKKFLSLVLALIMTMSLVTISAGATEFKDLADADPAYQEAIDLISDLGIVGGVTADTYQPAGLLTRGAATKFVANLMLGPDLAAKLPDGAAFTDIPAGSTFAKYAQYLKSQGVIGGYGDGSYGVKNGLTGDAFLKMVLGALGYDAAVEGYTGDGWQVNVALDAIEAGLVEGMKSGFNSSAVITRAEAAQIVLNALEAKTVKYENKSSISIGNVVINNASEAKYITSAAKDYDRAVTAATGDGYQQLIEKLFPGVEKDETVSDDFARPAVAWYNTKLAADKQQITMTVAAPVKVYAVSTSAKNTEGQDIYADLGLSAAANVTLYIDGAFNKTDKVDKSNSSNTYDTAIWGQHGAHLELYKDGTNYILVQVNEYIAQIDKVNAASGSTKRSVQLKALDDKDNTTAALALPTGITTDTKFETESFAKDDVVTFTVSKKGETATIESMALANAKVGKYTQLAGSTITVDGAAINLYVPFYRGAGSSNLTFGKEVKAYLNSNGHYIYVEMVGETETTLDKYAYVLAATTVKGEADWATGKDAADTYKAQVLFVDGTTAIVEVKESASALVNNFVTYGINAKGQYELKDATTGTPSAVAVSTVIGAPTATIGGTAVAVNNATTFIVKTEKTVGEEKEVVYTLYVGIKAVPAITTTGMADVIVKENAKAAAYIYIDATATDSVVKTEADKNDYIVISKGTTSTPTKYTNENGSWYNVKALINGEIKTIKLAEECWKDLRYTYFNYYKKYTVDEYGLYHVDGGDNVSGVFGDWVLDASSGSAATKKGVDYEDGVVILNNGADTIYKTLADDAIIVYMSSATATPTIWTVDQFAAYDDAKQNDQYWLKYTDSAEKAVIQILYIGKTAD